jgi:hypothetical protein
MSTVLKVENAPKRDGSVVALCRAEPNVAGNSYLIVFVAPTGQSEIVAIRDDRIFPTRGMGHDRHRSRLSAST